MMCRVISNQYNNFVYVDFVEKARYVITAGFDSFLKYQNVKELTDLKKKSEKIYCANMIESYSVILLSPTVHSAPYE